MLGLAGGAAVALAGCVSGPTVGSYTPTGDPVVDGRALMERAPAKDRVLWQYRTALAALRRGQLADARELLDEALGRIQNVYGPDRAAKRSRGTFNAEAKKTFIGEPYERVMAYYYRAVLYWMDGEPDNARACFRSGQLMDSDVEDQTYASDYVLLDYLDGFVTARLGGDGSDAYGRAAKAARLARPAPYYTNWNAFFFVEMGRGPTKYATGNYGEQLRFRPGSAKAARVRITVAGQTLHADPWDDLSFQATTRGGRVMDHVLANKAVFKRATDVAGTAAIVGGAVMAGHSGRNSAADEVGAGLIVAGVLSKIVSAATTPAADTRAWESLPQYLGFTATVLEPGEHVARVEFLDAQGLAVAGGVRTVNVRVGPDGGDAVVWVSDQDR
jgi:hypothetical protein